MEQLLLYTLPLFEKAPNMICVIGGIPIETDNGAIHYNYGGERVEQKLTDRTRRPTMKRTALFTAAVFILGTVSPALAVQDSKEGDRSNEYVPRAEYEQLKKMFEQQHEDYERLKLDVAELKQSQKQTETAVQQTKVAVAETKERASDGAQLFPASDIKPGWERARGPGWMEQGRLEGKSVRIAHMSDIDLYMGLDTLGRVQAIVQDNVRDTVGADSISSRRLRSGFQTAYGNMSFLADFNKQMELYFDIFLADKPHQNQLQGDEGYMLVRELPGPVGDIPLVKAVFEKINVKAGQFETDFGDSHYRRSNNAAVQRNALVGNPIIDPRATEVGMEVYTDEGALPLPVGVMVGFGSGTDTGDFKKGHQYSLRGKLWANPTEKLRTSASVYRVDHSGNSSSFTNLFRANRSGGTFAGLFDDGTSPGDITPGQGKRVFASQFDVTWEGNPVELYGNLGWFQDTDTNGITVGTPTESWLYYTGEAIYRFTPRLYVASRYSGASAGQLVSSASSNGNVTSGGMAHRIEVGGGYWLAKTLLLKAEYVYQIYKGFSSSGSQVSGVDAWRDPSFNGVITEVSFSF